MSAKLKLDGVATLAETLRGLPTALRDEAIPIVGEAVDAAEAEIAAGYPERSGNLRAGLRQDRSGGGLNTGARIVLKNTAKHAFLFETGSEYRHPDPAWVRRTRGDDRSVRRRWPCANRTLFGCRRSGCRSAQCQPAPLIRPKRST